MPRKSVAELLVVTPVSGKPSQLHPPSSLSEAERKTFLALVKTVDPKHFRPSDLPLLCRYCESIVMADRAAQELRKGGAVIDGKPSPWLGVQREAIKAMVALSMRLRLSPQSRFDPKTIGRQKLDTTIPPWEEKE